MDEIILEAKLVSDIQGVFLVPSYQRGYRWGEEEVTRLLSDIYDIFHEEAQTARNYCLQPIVVRRGKERFELIDGQQRLTTLYLIYKYMSIVSNGWLVKEPRFSLVYETRAKSAEFLENMDKSLRDDNIDFYFICNAYETIEHWFDQFGDRMSVVMGDFNACLAKYVKVIWYEVGESEDAIALFTHLNIGKIPLTSAELVKAMFLSRDNNEGMDKEGQEEIALQWDNIEKELHNDGLWYFLTNKANAEYQTRIDLVLDLIAGKTDKKEKYFTFFQFDGRRKVEGLKDIWAEILHTFLILKDWYGNHELYHKIGYLIASGFKTLADIYEASKGQTKKRFTAILDKYIKESIDISENYADLSYEKSGDYAKISRLLLLFNIESVRKNGEQTEWFPFHKFKYQEKGKALWSLEHIHAQQSQGMKRQEEWREWLKLHIPSIESLADDTDAELLAEMREKYSQPKLERQDFERLQEKVIARLSVSGNAEYMHSIANLALLYSADNAALNNSTFDVKRNEIIQMDKRGAFIPFCTKMVFLKYYTPSGENQLHFWGQPDRQAYVSAMNLVLKDYLKEPVTIEQPSTAADTREGK